MTEDDTGQDFAESTDGDAETDAPDGTPTEDAAPEADPEAAGDAEEGLVARVAAHDEELAAEVADLRERTDDLEAAVADREAEIEEYTERLKRTKADFQNYKKRAQRRREERERRATENLVERLLDVRDNLARALDQDEDADIREGVAATLRSFDDVLAAEDVEPIEPEPGDDLDPERHEALQRVAADQPAGTVVDVYRLGYEMGGSVLRTAQVTVAEE